MDVGVRHRHLRQQSGAGHAVVAFGIVGRDEALVAPEQMHALPRRPLAILVRRQELEQRFRRRTAGERDAQLAGFLGDALDQPVRDTLGQILRVRADYHLSSHRIAFQAAVPRMYFSTALAKPSSSYESVTADACCFTSSGALPIAMLNPAGRNISTSFGWSPMVAIF